MDSDIFSILIVDDEAEHRDVMKTILQCAGYVVSTASSAGKALSAMSMRNYDMLLTDLIMPDMDGIELMHEVRKSHPNTDTIIITGYGTIQNAVEAMKRGAYSYFIKSHDPTELLNDIDRLRRHKAEIRKDMLIKKQNVQDAMLTTKNAQFAKVIEIVEKSAISNANILLLGESGVGKEIMAQHIHNLSYRASGLFVPVNCHALPDGIISSELFGHEKGAFTGAVNARKGRVEDADGGTLFMDEIGEMDLSTQVRLLRTLETKSIERVGSNTIHKVDFRLVCATNRNLTEAVAEGVFRNDLYYRISTIVVEIPPLRARKEDLPGLTDYFIRKISKSENKTITDIDDRTMSFLSEYDYPGHIRELKNIIERLVILSENGRISYEDLPELNNTQSYERYAEKVAKLSDIKKDAERNHIIKVLAMSGNNVALAANMLGISRRQLFYKLNEYNIRHGQ